MRLNRAGRRLLRLGLLAVALAAIGEVPTPAQAPAASSAPFDEADARTWVTYLASDALQGREVFTEGYGMAAAYVAEQLHRWQVTPLGDAGTYLQTVRLRNYRVTRRSSLTIDLNGRSHRFADGDHVEFPLESGGRQTLTFTSAVVVTDPGGGAADGWRDLLARTDVRGRLVVYIAGRDGDRRRSADDDLDIPTRLIRRAGAAGVLTFEAGQGGRDAGGRRGNSAASSTLRTVADVYRLVPPVLTVDETVLDALVDASGEPLAAWLARARDGQPLPPSTVGGFTMRIAIDNQFEALSTQFTTNVVGMIEGTDPALNGRYVLFGAHLDHVGYAQGTDAKGRARTPVAEDPIWNGADDNASGTAGLMAIAQAFATGPRPRRSVVFVWHAGEEGGMLGSRYFVDFPAVPVDRIDAMFNIDMIGRNRDDREDETNTVYVIGADRISTDLHNLVVQTNRAGARPMTLDFEYNDPADAQSFYTRSDHYSYAERGIPIAFFFTGTHDDYHANTDTADRILYGKLVRVAALVHRIGLAAANRVEPLRHDYRGPRAGRGFDGREVLEAP